MAIFLKMSQKRKKSSTLFQFKFLILLFAELPPKFCFCNFKVQPSTNIQIIDTVSESCPEVSSDELDVIFAFHEALKKSSSPQCKLFLKTVKGGCNVIKNSLSANMDNLKLHRDNVIALFGGQTVTVADNFAVNPAALNNGVEITRLVLGQILFRL